MGAQNEPQAVAAGPDCADDRGEVTGPRPRRDASGAACPVCRGSDTSELPSCPEDYEYGVPLAPRFRVFSCGSCASEFVMPRPTVDEMAALYPDDYYAYSPEMGWVSRRLHVGMCRREAKRFLTLIQRRPVRLFDVGAGDCRRFKAIAPMGPFRFSGVELNGAMAAQARQAGFDVTHAAFEDYDPQERAGTMDVVIMNHVIEHVLDPEDTLRKARRLLADGGVVYGRTPKLDGVDRRLFGRYWGGYHFPRHLEIFPREALERLLCGCGFREVRIYEDLNRFLALSVQNGIVGALKLPLARAGGLTRLFPGLLVLTAPASVLEYLLGIGDCMTFVARK